MDLLSRWVLTFVLNSIWQVALVAGAAALADLALRRAAARYRHALWVVSLVAAILLPLVSTQEGKLKGATVSPPPQGSLAFSVPLSAASPTSTIVVRTNARRTRLSRAHDVLVAGTHPSVPVPRRMMRALLMVYASFLIFMLVRFARACLRAHVIRRLACADSLPAGAVSTAERCRQVMTGARWRSASLPAILWSEQVPGPVTVGALRAAIILPGSLRDAGASEDLEAALAHEMAHVCRCDYLWNLICELLLVPVAFHPVTWLLKRRLAEARELACDELAARVLDPSQYARSLVRIANQISRRASAAVKLDYTLGVFDANILEERVMTLLKPRASGRLAKGSVLLGALVIAFSCLFASRFSLAVGQASTTSSGATANAGNQVTQYAGALKGVSGGISGGVSSGPNGGVTGGLLAGVAGGVAGGVSGSPGASSYSPKASASSEGGAPAQAGANSNVGSLSGIVVDSSGARVPKATVWLVNRDSGARQDAETDETGGFAFKDLPAGRYTLNVMSAGMGGSFHMFTLKAEGQPPFFPFVLQPGTIAESAVVTAKLPPGVSVKAATTAGPRRIRIGGMVEGSKLIENSPQPVYPESAREHGIQGLVLLEATISADGVPTDLKVLSSPSDDLAQAAEDAVRQWRYRSTLLNGEPIAVLTTIAVDFRLEE